MRKLLLALLVSIPVICFAENGTVNLIGKLAPQGGGFVGIVDSSQTLINVTNFNRNLSTSDTNVQAALETLDNLVATGGGGIAVAYGSLSTSGDSIAVTGISTTPAKLSIFTTEGASSNTVVSASSDQITVSTAATFYVYANILSTGTGSYDLTFSIRVDGAEFSPPLTCSDTPSARCSMSGVVSLSSGSVLTVYGSASTGSQTMYVTDAQFQVSSLGGAGSSSGGSSGGSSVSPVYGSIYSSDVNIEQLDITTTPVKAAFFTSNGISNQTTPDHTTDQITITTTSAVYAFSSFISTTFFSASAVYYSEIRKNGAATGLTCRIALGATQDSISCLNSGFLSLTAGDVVALYVWTNEVSTNSMVVREANLSIMAVGGAGSGVGGGSSALEVFNNFDGTRSSPTASIGLSDAFRGTVSGSTYTFRINASSVSVLTNGLVPNAQIDGSSITKQGLLVAGSNVTLTPGAGTLTIASTGGGSDAVLAATQTFTGGNTFASTVTISGAASVLRIPNSATTGTPVIKSNSSPANGFGVDASGAYLIQNNVPILSATSVGITVTGWVRNGINGPTSNNDVSLLSLNSGGTDLVYYNRAAITRQSPASVVREVNYGLRDKAGESPYFFISPNDRDTGNALTDVMHIDVSTFAATSGFVGLDVATPTVRLSVAGFINTSTTTAYPVPALSSCGTSPSLSLGSTDTSGKITVGGGTVTSCTLTFGTEKGKAPACTILSDTAMTSPAGATTTTTFTVSAGATFNGNVIMFSCFGNE